MSEPGSGRRSVCKHCGSGVSRANVRENTYECPSHGVISGASVLYVEDDGLRADGSGEPSNESGGGGDTLSGDADPLSSSGDSQTGSEQYEDAICPGCGRVLTGSREPGDIDHCQHADREVRLEPANLNLRSNTVNISESDRSWIPDATREAIEKQRNGNRVPVHFDPDPEGTFYDHGVVP